MKRTLRSDSFIAASQSLFKKNLFNEVFSSKIHFFYFYTVFVSWPGQAVMFSFLKSIVLVRLFISQEINSIILNSDTYSVINSILVHVSFL